MICLFDSRVVDVSADPKTGKDKKVDDVVIDSGSVQSLIFYPRFFISQTVSEPSS
jgi:hypothetical protein